MMTIKSATPARLWVWRALITVAMLVATTVGAKAAGKVALLPSYSQNPTYGNAGLNQAVEVWGRAWGFTGVASFTLDYGDGTTPLTGSFNGSTTYIGALHTYTT